MSHAPVEKRGQLWLPGEFLGARSTRELFVDAMLAAEANPDDEAYEA